MSDEETEDLEQELDVEEQSRKEDDKELGEDFDEQFLPPKPITEDILKEGLSLLCKTGNGLAHAYVKLDAKEKELTDITLLSSYIHLRYVDVSENFLSDLSPLNSLTHLLWLKADKNRLRTAHLEELPYLQIVSFAHNRISGTEGITHPRLTSLDLKGNFIQRVTGLDPLKLGNLHTIELRGNQLESTAGLHLPKLKYLYLAQNNLRQLEGLESLEHLCTLHLRDNQVEVLDGFSPSMKALQYLNLRGNMIADLAELEKLQVLPKLRALILLENPCVDEGGYRVEALVHVPHLERLDKDFYDEEERAEADETRQRLREEQEIESIQEVSA